MNKIGNWPTRALYGFVALAMVLSLVLLGGAAPTAGTTEPIATQGSEGGPIETIAPPGNGAGPDIPELLVDIERPTSGTSFNISDTFYVNAVVAFKDVNNVTGVGSTLVTATIDTGQNAVLVEDDIGQEIKTATINRNCVGDFWWKVKCTGADSTNITVTATDGGLEGQDSVTVTQGTPEPECKLVIEITEPERDELYVNPCTYFAVKATFTNNTTSTIEDVIATIYISDEDLAERVGDPASRTVGDILPGDSQERGWNLHCKAVGDVVITVNATATGLSDPDICEDSVTVHQGEEEEEEPTDCCLNVTIDAPTEICTVGCNYSDYQIIANITNNCGFNCTNITATISKIAGPASADINSPLQQSAGNLTGGNSTTVTWNVSCIGLDDVTFKVEAQGDETRCCGEDTHTVEQKKILIDLIEPASNATIEHNICQTFNVTANISNCDCDSLANVTVELALPDSVCITANTTIHVTQYDQDGYEDDWDIDPEDLDDPEKIPFSSFCACCIYQIEWIDLHCCNATPDYGQTAEEVYIRVWDDGTLMEEDYFWVKQTEKAHLAAGVGVYLGTSASNVTGPTPFQMGTTPATAVAVNQSFVVVVPVINMGMAAAQNVSVNVTITGDATCNITHNFTLGTIPGRTAVKRFITCNCTGDENVYIYISALSGTDTITGEEILGSNIFPCGEWTLQQIPITIDIIQPEAGQNFTCSDLFNVKVKVTNGATNATEILQDVTATINWTGPGGAELTDDDPLERPLGDIPAGNWSEATWNLHCTSMGNVTFTVEIESETPAWSDFKTVTVQQEATSNLTVEILSPMDGSAYRTSEEFAVTANVTVVSAAGGVVNNVTATLTDCGFLEVVEDGDRSIDLDSMAVNQSQIVSWTVHAVKAGTQCDPASCTITVNATAPCADPGSYDKTVYIYPAANLKVDITNYPEEDIVVCDNFNVTARVTNIGWADATGVKLLLSVIPDDSVRPVKGDNSYEKDIGTLVGYGQSEVEDVGYKEITWNLHCKMACESTITIEPVGYDECGWYYYYDGEQQDWEVVDTPQPGRAIEEKFLHADSVTVKQVEPTELAVDITYPSDGAEFYGGDEPDSFVVTAKVTNIGEQAATAVNATIDIRAGDPAELDPPPAATQTISIPSGESKVVSWNLVAGNATGSAVITVTAVGTNTALDVVTVKIDPAPVQVLYEGVNPIAYQGETEYLPAALTNIEEKLEIIWQRDATTGGEWNWFYLFSGSPQGQIEKLVEGTAYIVVVSENCEWKLVH